MALILCNCQQLLIISRKRHSTREISVPIGYGQPMYFREPWVARLHTVSLRESTWVVLRFVQAWHVSLTRVWHHHKHYALHKYLGCTRMVNLMRKAEGAWWRSQTHSKLGEILDVCRRAHIECSYIHFWWEMCQVFWGCQSHMVWIISCCQTSSRVFYCEGPAVANCKITSVNAREKKQAWRSPTSILHFLIPSIPYSYL